MLSVVTFLWRDEQYRWNRFFRYGPDHVNRLRNMVRRNLKLDHEFCCITDDSSGIEKDIRIVPLWDDLRHMGRCYVRLKAFSEEMREVIGERFVSIDLDAVIVRDITPVLDRNEDFVIWGDVARNTPYNGSMWMMNAGARKQVWEDFDPETSPGLGKKRGYIGSDQAWMAVCLGAGESKWGQRDGVYSFRRHILPRRRNLPLGLLRRRCPKGVNLPEPARIVFFHGHFDPSQPAIQGICPWIGEHWR